MPEIWTFGERIMTQRAPRTLGIGSIIFSLISIGAYAYSSTLPYRLSGAQERSLQEALLVHFFGAVLALATAVTANVLTRLQRTERHGALEIFSLLFAVAALLLVLFTAHVHSTSHRTNSNESPNKVDRIQAAKIASQLSVGMQEEAAEKFLSRNGITNSLKLGCSHGWTSVFILSDGCILALDVAPKQAGADGAWAGGLLRAADIQSNGVKIVSIILTNAP